MTCHRLIRQLDFMILLFLAGDKAILSARIALAQPTNVNKFRIIVENVQPTSSPGEASFPNANNKRWMLVIPQAQHFDPCVSRRARPPCTKCPGDYAVLVPRGKEKIKLTWDPPQSCNREKVRQTYGPISGTEFAEGTHRIQYEISTYECGILAHCQFHILVRVRRCSSFRPPDHSTVTCTLGSSWGSTCYFTCKPGYQLCGGKSVTCVEFGSYLIWSRKLPTCQTPDQIHSTTEKNEVPILPETTVNRFFTDTELITWPTTVTEVPVTFMLNTTEAQPLTSPPRELECPMLAEIAFGYFRCNNHDNPLRPGTLCQYICNYGHYMPAEDKHLEYRTCLENYEWNATQAPQCVATLCPELQVMEGVHMSCDNPIVNHYFPGTICEYYCPEGHHIPQHLLDFKVKKCLEGGNWNNTRVPECREVECPDPPILKHGRMTCMPRTGRFWPTTRCEYSCKEGFIMKNPEYNIIDCGVEGRWLSTNIPKCEPLQCSPPNNPRNGYFICNPPGVGLYLPGMSCDIHCFHGYGMWHPEHRSWSCDISGKWKKSGNAICEVIQCQRPPKVENGRLSCDPQVKDTFPLGAKCKYLCNKGYILSDEQQKLLTCEETGLWNPKTYPTCQKKACPKPPKVKNGRLVCNASESRFYPINTVCKYECLDGFYIQQKFQKLRVRVCDSTFAWNVTGKPRCTKKAKPCRQPPVPVHGYLNCTNEAIRDKYEAGTTCQFNCEEGYVIPTSYLPFQFRQCDNFGKWNTSKYPSCKKAVVPKSDECFRRTYVLDSQAPLAIKWPKFYTEGGKPVEAKCTIDELSFPGIYENICLAKDPELRVTGTCTYGIIIEKASKCKLLTPPVHSELNCQAEPEICEMKCKNNRTLLYNQKLVKVFTMECLDDGKWDYENEPGSSLPECVKTLPKTYLKSGMSFSVEISSCNNSDNYVELHRLIQNKLLEDNFLCDDIDCTDYDTLCENNRPGGDLPITPMMKVNWNVVATYEPENEEAVSDAENHINTVMETTEKLIKTEGFQRELRGYNGILREGSWSFNPIELICTEAGFVADPNSLLCHECGVGSYQKGKTCTLCPHDQYQDEIGAVTCNLCPENHSTDKQGATSKADCKQILNSNTKPS